MKKTIKSSVVILIVLGLLVMWSVTYYNKFVSQEENVTNKWAQVETQYQRRFDLVPNLVESVKGSANFQQETLTEVTAARSAWAQAQENGNINQQVAAANSFDSALSRLLVTVEAYPELNTAAFQDLMVGIEGTENRVSVARKDYNDAVQVYNLAVRRIPGKLFAGIYGFAEKTPFESVEGSEVAPQVNFS
ncbi:MAG: LemA family protein [Candidatus Gracilibacteria bacterium]|nr:LemA family protein [Candidatus Gracilibacteria bacterium]